MASCKISIFCRSFFTAQAIPSEKKENFLHTLGAGYAGDFDGQVLPILTGDRGFATKKKKTLHKPLTNNKHFMNIVIITSKHI